MPSLSVEFTLAAILAIVLHFAASKNNPILSGILLLLLFGLCLDLPLRHLPWVTNAQPIPTKAWRIATVICFVLIVVWRFGIWVWPANSSKSSNVGLPKIEFIRPITVRLSDFYSSLGGETQAVLASFRNDSTVGQQHRFAAHIIYKDVRGNEIADVGRGVWLPRDGNHRTTVSFAAGITRNLAIFFLDNGKLAKPLVYWVNEPVGGYSMPFPRIKREEIAQKVSGVDVRLLTETEDHPPVIFHLKVVDYRDGELPSLLRRD